MLAGRQVHSRGCVGWRGGSSSGQVTRPVAPSAVTRCHPEVHLARAHFACSGWHGDVMVCVCEARPNFTQALPSASPPGRHTLTHTRAPSSSLAPPPSPLLNVFIALLWPLCPNIWHLHRLPFVTFVDAASCHRVAVYSVSRGTRCVTILSISEGARTSLMATSPGGPTKQREHTNLSHHATTTTSRQADPDAPPW
jgi:hypothetical protein